MLKQTFRLRLFALARIPLIAFLSPSVLELTQERCVVCIPLTRRARNHFGSMYFGALCVGADCAGGLMAFDYIQESGQRVSFAWVLSSIAMVRSVRGWPSCSTKIDT